MPGPHTSHITPEDDEQSGSARLTPFVTETPGAPAAEMRCLLVTPLGNVSCVMVTKCW